MRKYNKYSSYETDIDETFDKDNVDKSIHYYRMDPPRVTIMHTDRDNFDLFIITNSDKHYYRTSLHFLSSIKSLVLYNIKVYLRNKYSDDILDYIEAGIMHLIIRDPEYTNSYNFSDFYVNMQIGRNEKDKTYIYTLAVIDKESIDKEKHRSFDDLYEEFYKYRNDKDGLRRLNESGIKNSVPKDFYSDEDREHDLIALSKIKEEVYLRPSIKLKE